MATEDLKIFSKKVSKPNRTYLRTNQTFYEKILWSKLRDRQLASLKFRRQYSIGTYIVDFYCPENKIAIEIDGDSHYNEQAEQYDAEREKFISSYGIRICRFTNMQIRENIEAVLGEILKKL
jgi:very-short-patch-repair endonuclease